MFNIKKKKKDLPENIEEIVDDLQKVKKENQKLQKEVKEIKEDQKFFLQNVGIIRFNPFNGEGGNQSFSMAFLDKNGTGVVVTSLYTKEGNRVYGKPVKEGSSNYSLSKEEEKAIKTALSEEK